jgi:hypothetical protein
MAGVKPSDPGGPMAYNLAGAEKVTTATGKVA